MGRIPEALANLQQSENMISDQQQSSELYVAAEKRLHLETAEYYRASNQTHLSIESYRNCLELNVCSALKEEEIVLNFQALVNLSIVLQESGMYDEALLSITRALDIVPRNSVISINLKSILVKLYNIFSF